ncbi:hypothetical protein BDP27DRAFT_1356499 [Rhodocollybia butyracea]|uniref:Uncharacterized protein n=1 Tax=Rhodocollybia butyracea TaxID=206335 RepID=A0A9P5Q584_9AGAR|nr:hypothetical protein BDP27DRAFT_1356499 [Rhodocollybia butyracea]
MISALQMSNQSSTSMASSPSVSGFSRALEAHTALFVALIEEERANVAASFEERLAQVEAQLKSAHDEVAALNSGSSSLRHQLEVAKKEAKTRETESERSQNGAMEYMRQVHAKFATMEDEMKKQLSEAARKNADLDSMRSALAFRVQMLEREVSEATGVGAAAKREVESLKAHLADKERSLSTSKSLEASQRLDLLKAQGRTSTLEREIATIKESTRAERQRLIEEKRQMEAEYMARLDGATRDRLDLLKTQGRSSTLEREIATIRESTRAEKQRLNEEKREMEAEYMARLDRVTSEAANHEARANAASSQCSELKQHALMLIQDLEKEKRAHNSDIIALQRQIESTSSASRQEVAQVHEQLSTLGQALSSAVAARRAAETERDAIRVQTDTELVHARNVLNSARVQERAVEREHNRAVNDLVTTFAFLRRDSVKAQATAEEKLKGLRCQLSAVQQEGSIMKERFERRLSSLALVIRHHHLASLDVDTDILKPSPELLDLWKGLSQLASGSHVLPSHTPFPDVFTEHTNPAIPTICSLVDEISHNIRQQHGLSSEEMIVSSQEQINQFANPKDLVPVIVVDELQIQTESISQTPPPPPDVHEPDAAPIESDHILIQHDTQVMPSSSLTSDDVTAIDPILIAPKRKRGRPGKLKILSTDLPPFPADSPHPDILYQIPRFQLELNGHWRSRVSILSQNDQEHASKGLQLRVTPPILLPSFPMSRLSR